MKSKSLTFEEPSPLNKGKNTSFSEEYEYLKKFNIWEQNPVFQDINAIYSNLRVLSVLAVAIFFVIVVYIMTSRLFEGFLLGIFVLIFFMISFHDTMFGLKGIFSGLFHKYRQVENFEKFTCYFTSDDENILYITNREEGKTIALSIFKIDILPETTHENLGHFIKALNEVNLPFTFQIHQHPLMYSVKKGEFKEYRDQQAKGKMGSFQTAVYLTVYYCISGIVTSAKLKLLRHVLKNNIDQMETGLTEDYHHYKPELLSEKRLLYALRSFVVRDIPHEIPKQREAVKPKINLLSYIAKIGFCAFIFILLTYFLILLKISTWIIFLLDLVLVFIVLFVWWRALLYHITARFILTRDDLILVDPFEGVKIYKYRGFTDSIFISVDDKLLIHEYIFNLEQALETYYYDIKKNVQLSNVSTQKFYHALIEKQLPFIYTIISSPLSYRKFDDLGYDYTNDGTKGYLYKNVDTDEKGAQWLRTRAGIWNTMLTLSTYTHKSIKFLEDDAFIELYNQSEGNATKLQNAFDMGFIGYQLTPLTNRRLLSGCICEILKTKLYTLAGTYLKYLLFQGNVLKVFIRIEDEFKKGIETRLPVEFNNPLHLENDIIFGQTVNTEFWKKEVLVGFTREQLSNILIVNGVLKSRENLAMKLISELVKEGIPSLIFDISGEWSKLIDYFRNTNYMHNIVHFQLGSAFGIDPLRSDIPYDKNNTAYLEYIYDSYAFTFKKDIDTFRNLVRNNPDLDMAALDLELKNQQPWQKGHYTNTLISLFDELTENDKTYFHSIHSDQGNQEQIITFKDFILDNKTVIIDLSRLNNIKKQIFSVFIIISKIIHYITQFDNFHSKVLFLPQTDLFFTEKYLDRTMEYAKITNFLEPLRREGFGMVFDANQIHYLHPHFLKFFRNIITFQATEYRDIKVLKNIMGLQELRGMGYYGGNRKSTYQIEYLMHMSDDEVIVKREDTNQPFLAEIEAEDIEEAAPMESGEIKEFMKNQGYDLQSIERRILDSTRKTIFEKDFGKHSRYINEIIIFLDGLKMVHKVPLYEHMVKDELKKVIHDKAVKIAKDKRELKEIRNELFNILITQRYLIETHPRSPGGQQTIRTSYQVGLHYDNALQDYFQNKNDVLANVAVDVLEQEQNPDIDLKNERKIDQCVPELVPGADNFEEVLTKEMSTLGFELFQIFKFMSRNDYKSAMQIEKQFLRKFLTTLYQKVHDVEDDLTSEVLDSFLNYITKHERLPFTKKELYKYLNHCDKLEYNDEILVLNVKETYEMLSEFFNQLQDHITLSYQNY